MKNKYLRLFVAQTKLMTAEKMQLDKFCQTGEYFAYRITLPSLSGVDLHTVDDISFTFNAELEKSNYRFSDENIDDSDFSEFERHLSEYLNELFQRKREFERRNQLFQAVVDKITASLSEEERQCLAMNIDANVTNVLKALGVIFDDDAER